MRPRVNPPIPYGTPYWKIHSTIHYMYILYNDVFYIARITAKIDRTALYVNYRFQNNKTIIKSFINL